MSKLVPIAATRVIRLPLQSGAQYGGMDLAGAQKWASALKRGGNWVWTCTPTLVQ
jgi:hypothetical protein